MIKFIILVFPSSILNFVPQIKPCPSLDNIELFIILWLEPYFSKDLLYKYLFMYVLVSDQWKEEPFDHEKSLFIINNQKKIFLFNLPKNRIIH